MKSDLMIPEDLTVSDLAAANAKGKLWCEEVNSVVHSEICAIPAERLVTERALFSDLPSLRAAIGKTVTRKVDKLSCVRFGSARYSVPNEHIGRTVELRIRDGVIDVVFLGTVITEHLIVSPGENSVNDDHYGGPRPMPKRPVRPKSREEKAFCELGPVAEAFIKGAAAQGMTGLARDMDLFAQMEQFHGRAVVIEGLERAVAFGRFRAKDVESIILSRSGVPRPRRAGQALIVELPVVPVRPLSDYAIADQS